MMHCRPSNSMMMCRHRVNTLAGVPSLVDEVVELNARNVNFDRTQQGALNLFCHLKSAPPTFPDSSSVHQSNRSI